MIFTHASYTKPPPALVSLQTHISLFFYQEDDTMKVLLTDKYDLRAYRAYASATERAGAILQQPSSPTTWEGPNGRRYVVLSNMSGFLAVFRVKPGDRLKRLKRWPAALLP